MCPMRPIDKSNLGLSFQFEDKMNQRTGEEWKQARYECVTGTDVAKIMGCDDSCSRKKLMELKIARVDPMDTASDYTKHMVSLGTTFERAALSEFRLVAAQCELGKNGYVPGMSPHPVYDWFTGTPDYILEAPDGTKCVVEIKTHWFPSACEACPMDIMKKKHWLQVQSYLEILDLNVGYLWSWTMSNGYALFRIERARDFWNGVVWPQILFFHDIFEFKRSLSVQYNDNQLAFGPYEKLRMEELVTVEMDKTTQLEELEIF